MATLTTHAPDVATRPFIIEIVGAIGAGKTTLFETLRARDPKITPPICAFDKISLSFHLIKNSLQILPLFAAKPAAGLSITAAELKYLARFFLLYEAIRRPRHVDNLVLSEHGPMFRLAYFRVFGSPFARTSVFRQWENDWRHVCSKMFDMIVWLDAPDDVLIKRINARTQFYRKHDMVGKGIETKLGFFAQRRAIYRDMIANCGVPALKIDTNQTSIQEWTEHVSHAIRDIRHSKNHSPSHQEQSIKEFVLR